MPRPTLASLAAAAVLAVVAFAAAPAPAEVATGQKLPAWETKEVVNTTSVDAAEALVKLKAKIADMKPKKALPFVKGFTNSWKGTKAGEKAEKLLTDLERRAD